MHPSAFATFQRPALSSAKPFLAVGRPAEDDARKFGGVMTSAERYDQAARRMLAVMQEHRDTLRPVKWAGKPFPWDTFCKANPEAQKLAYQVNAELNYELSEHQCSWAVVQFCG